MKFVFLFLHVLFGLSGTIFASIAYINVLVRNKNKIVQYSFFEFLSTIFASITAGIYYVCYYQSEKHIIINGKFPAAHFLFMEVKEHSFITLFLLSLYFQIRIHYSPFESENQFYTESKVVLICLLILGVIMSAFGILINIGFRINQ